MSIKHHFFQKKTQSLDEQYFSEVRFKLYELHADHPQTGIREGRSFAEHLDSACQFVSTVSKLAQVPDEKRACILAATAVHNLNKFEDAKGGKVRELARNAAFLTASLRKAGWHLF